MSAHTLFQVGMDLEAPSTAQKEDTTHGRPVIEDDRKDHFITKNGVDCAGMHLIIDLHEAEGIDDIELIDATLRDCVEVAGATLLHMHLHHFTPNSGVSGVAVLAESHISIHTWPERGYAALDVFMCGDSAPERCIEVLRRAFKPQRINVTELLRGEGA
ncbi:S-adenosylmethionine decarboxylase [Rhodoligotrophos appendicifer]|uniref:adenosylmethionine decarboxylase n=1 Tax=Rhodoligotrophos appendicifer TaxID=987056 RepID=UPI0011861BF8|nr:adenosylmethionine decarboxylase [Rhodoligotrophos appendicifer]